MRRELDDGARVHAGPVARLALAIAALAATLLVAATSPTPADARVPRDALFAGSTSKDRVVVLRTSSTGRRIRMLRIHWSDSCRRRAERYTEFEPSDRIRIRSDGSFSKRVRYREGSTGRRVRARVAGRVGARRARGRFRARSRTQSGRLCKSGRIRWRASRIAIP